ncbi:TetR family transcriptional regulator [Duganella sp. Leaf126]|uniref:TetR/AcrR family transcriptional regulator n=1 Tax=Duganella sp. Leaf126 TaxID=1736266 RepID=UPI0006FCF770|nr:TetR/AcrR family transcriptional regulator [Duganella sp. Leaf126]KQQ32704.1 TetR family transcriptional regulator [Duganella sp. Leaf126]
MTRRSRADMIETTRATLIATARRAFAEHGYAQTSMDQFTAAAGLTRGALYHHFGSKEKLLLAVIDQLEGEVALQLQARADVAPTPWLALRARLCGYLELARVPELRRIILQDARAMFGDVPQVHQSAGIGVLAHALQALMDDGTVAPGHAGVLARMLYGAVTEAAFWIAEDAGPDCTPDDADAEADIRLAASIASLDQLLRGLLAR